MLEPRAQHLLKTLIERYVSDGQPVGSRALSRHSGLDLSPATVRNVMADLEEMGFIASPHTSAGRVPTAKGYRFFVDSLMVTKALEQVEIDRLEGELVADRPQQLVSTAAGLLSQLTQFAGVVMTPKRRDATFRHLEFLRLAERRVLLILVTAEGDVQNRILHTDRSYSHAQLAEATNFFNEHFAGQTFATIRLRISDELRALKDDIARLMTAAVDAGEGALSEGESLVVTGERNLLHTRRLRFEHGAAAPAVRPVRPEDVDPASARPVATRAGRAHLHRQRVGPRAARRVQRGDRAVRSRTARWSARSASSVRRAWRTSAWCRSSTSRRSSCRTRCRSRRDE